MTRRTIAVCLVLWSISLPAWAGTAEEIDHLLVFIDSSGCTFVRNGQQYDAAAAREHIEGKYDYVKRSVETAEQFIEYAATGSSISGSPYRVICSGHEQLTAGWLTSELARFRTTATNSGGDQ